MVAHVPEPPRVMCLLWVLVYVTSNEQCVSVSFPLLDFFDRRLFVVLAFNAHQGASARVGYHIRELMRVLIHQVLDQLSLKISYLKPSQPLTFLETGGPHIIKGLKTSSCCGVNLVDMMVEALAYAMMFLKKGLSWFC